MSNLESGRLVMKTQLVVPILLLLGSCIKSDSMEERHYFVAGLGVIAYEIEITEENGEKTVIASRLQSISY